METFKINEFNVDNMCDHPAIVMIAKRGSGKSWVCNQLDTSYNYISYDDTPKEQHLHLMLNGENKPIIYDPWRKATSFKKRYGDIFNVKLIVITVSESLLKERLEGRGGTFDSKSIKYCKRANTIALAADFSGSSEEVLTYLISINV